MNLPQKIPSSEFFPEKLSLENCSIPPQLSQWNGTIPPPIHHYNGNIGLIWASSLSAINILRIIMKDIKEIQLSRAAKIQNTYKQLLFTTFWNKLKTAREINYFQLNCRLIEDCHFLSNWIQSEIVYKFFPKNFKDTFLKTNNKRNKKKSFCCKFF